MFVENQQNTRFSICIVFAKSFSDQSLFIFIGEIEIFILGLQTLVIDNIKKEVLFVSFLVQMQRANQIMIVRNIQLF